MRSRLVLAALAREEKESLPLRHHLDFDLDFTFLPIDETALNPLLLLRELHDRIEGVLVRP